MIVRNRALDARIGLRTRVPFPRARDAFGAILQAQGVGPGDKVLLPAYIGWSAREGSGVYDPVREVGAEGLFVRVDRNLTIDLEDFRAKIALRPKMVVLIHYFGFPDPAFAEMVALCREAEIPILEDEAHALLSDLVGGACGRWGDAVIFSLHKQLACLAGGELRLNASAPESWRAALTQGARDPEALDPADYDLHALAVRRITNARTLQQSLALYPSLVKPLWSQIPPGVVPQTWPVVIQKANRDELYQRFIDAGFGGTSLYHTMIEEITEAEFPDSHLLARRIFNLPVHPDASPEDMERMSVALIELLQ